MKHSYILFLLLAFIATGCATSRGLSSSILENQELKEELELIRVKYNLPSLAAVVVSKSGISSIAATGKRAFDHSDLVTISDKYHLGSNTKSMTAMLLAKLVEDKKLNWNDKLENVFPKMIINKELKNIKLINLLRHRGGLTTSISKSYPKLWKKLYQMQSAPNREAVHQRSLLVKRALGEEPQHRPQFKSNYSNTGIIVVGHAIENHLGEPFEKSLIDNLFSPLSLDSCNFGAAGSVQSIDQPRGHLFYQGKLHSIPPGPLSGNPDVVAPAGKVHCSLTDWGLYISEHLKGNLEGTDYLSKDTFHKLHNVLEGKIFGLGWLQQSPKWLNGGSALFHNGSNTLNYAEMWIVPEVNIGIGVVTNIGNKEAMVAVREVVKKALTSR